MTGVVDDCADLVKVWHSSIVIPFIQDMDEHWIIVVVNSHQGATFYDVAGVIANIIHQMALLYMAFYTIVPLLQYKDL